jgi:hypothetical protein
MLRLMSVLIEALCVVLKASAVIDRFPGGFDSFAASLPPGTYCADGDLVRVGFMRTPEVLDFVAKLERAGFIARPGAHEAELVVVDASRGLLAPCAWAEFARVRSLVALLGPVAICKRPGTPDEPVMTPEGWEYERSLSKPFSSYEG